jgi:hypothetical protein
MRKLRLDVPGYAFPMQLWPQAAHAGLRITEIPVRLIYNDPTRHFGGKLDDASNRLRHYLEVLRAELERIEPGRGREVPTAEEAIAGATSVAAVPSPRAEPVGCGCS